uniref:Secreted protein n=1 Tax=Panagrellus redivivus TaxID=6233 RepID=A0A7E4ZPZ5_PANRE
MFRQAALFASGLISMKTKTQLLKRAYEVPCLVSAIAGQHKRPLATNPGKVREGDSNSGELVVRPEQAPLHCNGWLVFDGGGGAPARAAATSAKQGRTGKTGATRKGKYLRIACSIGCSLAMCSEGCSCVTKTLSARALERAKQKKRR